MFLKFTKMPRVPRNYPLVLKRCDGKPTSYKYLTHWNLKMFKFHCNSKQWTRPNYIPLFDMDKSNQQPVSIQLVLLTNLFCWLNFHVSWQIPTLQHAENTTPCFSVDNKHMCCSNVDVLLFKPINILMNYPNSKPKVAQKSQKVTFSNKNPRIFCIFPPFFGGILRDARPPGAQILCHPPPTSQALGGLPAVSCWKKSYGIIQFYPWGCWIITIYQDKCQLLMGFDSYKSMYIAQWEFQDPRMELR